VRVLLKRFEVRSVVSILALVVVLVMAGCGGSNSSSSGANATATPMFSPGAGTYNASQTVTIADTTKGAVLYCTTDGTTPTTSSPHCGQPTTVYQTEFLQAIAVAPGQVPSAVASAGYTIDLNAVPTPTFSPAGSTLTSGQQVTITDTLSSANIYYTTDGTVPTKNSLVYSGPIALTKSATLSAIATASGYSNSGVASAAYVISTTPSTPVISPAGGTFTAITPVTITDATAGASIFYTTDGSTPTSGSMPYSGAFNVGATETVSAIAIAPGGSSSVATAVFTVNIPVTPAPTFSPTAGTYTTTQTVLLSDTNSSAVINYTTDGSMPTSSSSSYSGPITVSTSETIKAIATAPGFATSAVSSAAYTINPPVAAPTFNPGAGSYMSAQSVTISDATSGANIFYTIDGSTPTTTSTPYSGTPIAVSANETLSAIAAIGTDISTVTVAAYTINVGPSLTGTVMSGTLPVVGASVQIYAASNQGYASSATPEATTAATTGSDGSFTLNYNCPAAGGDLVYVVASGGHTGSNTASNAGLSFMAALGSCIGTLPKPLVVNEATTVASAYALAQFMTSATNVGAPSSNYEKGSQTAPGLMNAFATVGNLVDLTTGTVRDHTPAYSLNLAGDPNILNNSTVPQARINTLADALNACAADGSGCSDLFSAAKPPSGTAPSDTLQSILNIAQNPGSNVGMVFNVASESPSIPFTPNLLAGPNAPNDWTLALTYTGGGLGFAPGFQITNLTGPPFTDGQFLSSAMAIDATGNVWVTGFTLSRGGGEQAGNVDTSSGMIAEFNNLGAPLTPPSQVTSGATPSASYGGFIAIKGTTNGGTQAPHAISFDPSGNAWVVGGEGEGLGSGGAMAEISPSLSVVNPGILLPGGGLTSSPLAIDGLGNIWTHDGVNLDEFNNSGTVIAHNNGANSTQGVSGYDGFQYLIFDSNASSLWASAPSATFGDLFQINPADGSDTFDYYWNPPPGKTTPLVAGPATSSGNPGNVYGCGDAPGQVLDVYNVSTTSILTSYPVPTGRGCGNQMVMDGANHIFTVSGSTPVGILDEFTVGSTGINPVSPSTGYTGTSSGESPVINPDPSAPLPAAGSFPPLPTNGIMGAAIDGSGNLWVLNTDTGTTTSPGNVLVEFVGIAAPIVTPTSQALANGQVAVRP
jgi:hypothetical protein